MYKTLQEQMSTCQTISEWVIVVFIDVRGFTVFCGSHGTKETALFIKKAYLQMLGEKYYSKICFSKPTGDGMIFVIPYGDGEFKTKMDEVIDKAIMLVEDFQSFRGEDDMVYFDTPENIGIGISRGEACCLRNADGIIDYSGQVLNTAARLMDIARPKGIVIKNTFKLDKKHTSQFSNDDEIYLRGVAETEPIPVYFTEEWTTFESVNKIPFGIGKWIKNSRNFTYKELGDGLGTADLSLNNIPLSESAIEVYFRYPPPNGIGANWYNIISKPDYYIQRQAGKYTVRFKVDYIREMIKKGEITEDSKCIFEVSYPIRYKEHKK